MKKVLAVIGMVTILFLSACSGGMTQQEPDPISVVQGFYGAIKDKQLDAAMEYVADDALFINPTGTYTGKEEVRDNISALIDANLYFDLRDFKDDEGRVSYGYTTIIDSQSVEEGTNGYTVVKNGKVVFDGLQDTAPEEFR